MNFKKMNNDDFKALSKIVGEPNIKVLDEIDEKFKTDYFQAYVMMPECHLVAENKEQVVAIMKYANENKIPVTVRGAGSGLVGGSVALERGIVLDLSSMKKIIEVDQVNMTVTVEPGVTLFEIYEAVEKVGLFYAPDPGNKYATIGGNISTNAGGMRAVKYGTTRDWVRGLEVVTPTGELMKFGGKVVKNSTGYDLKDLIVGSEGTLAVIVRATLKLIAKPKHTASMLVAFDSREKALSAPSLLMNEFVLPTAVEFFEKYTLISSHEIFQQLIKDERANSYLILSYDNNDLNILNNELRTVKELLLNKFGALKVVIPETEADINLMWNARYDFLIGVRKSTPAIDECDVVLPRSNISPFFKYVRELSEDLGVRIPYFGHIGDGNLHVYLCKDNLSESDWEEKLEKGFKALYAKAAELGGFISGEHGIGIAKKAYMHEQLGKSQIALMQGIKKVFDPNGILNPHKIV